MDPHKRLDRLCPHAHYLSFTDCSAVQAPGRPVKALVALVNLSVIVVAPPALPAPLVSVAEVAAALGPAVAASVAVKLSWPEAGC